MITISVMKEFTLLIKFIPNPSFRRICNKKRWLTELNAFSIPTVTGKPSSANVFAISKISEITLPLLPINLFLTYAVWLEEVREGNTFFCSCWEDFTYNFHICIKQWYWPPVLKMNLLSFPFFQHFDHSLFLRTA